MTITGNAADLATMREQAEEMVKAYNEAYQSEDYKSAKELEEKLEELVNKYTSIVRVACFQTCKESADPMLTAVTMLYFTTIAVKEEKVGEDKIPVRSIIDRNKQIDLIALDRYCGGIGKEKNWKHFIQKFNYELTAARCKELGIDPKEVNDSFLMSDIAREYDMGKNPASKTNLLKSLSTIIKAMLGDEYKPLSHDVAFLGYVYSRKSRKALTVSMANHNQLTKYIAEVCHRIVTGKQYNADYKRKKEHELATQFVEMERPTDEEDKKEGIVTAA